ncbi:MAG: toll/interleukin-1 receptor domain-containing protein [Lachnospiraceae bacterium]|nr:toll/interleukin-1 receptor domain-containing protein [Lachnospiraceae bacterium]
MKRRNHISFITADKSLSAAGKEIVFISYRHTDKKYLEKVEDAFIAHTDFALWHDANLSVGEEFDKEILDAISISNIFVAIITPNYFNESSYTYRKEIPLAKQYGLIPVAIICEDITKEQIDFLKEWTEYIYKLDSIAFEQIVADASSAIFGNKETEELERALKRIDCSYITMSEVETLVKNHESIQNQINDMILGRYANLLHFCGLVNSDKQY